MGCTGEAQCRVARETEQHEPRSAGALPCVQLLEPPTNVEGGLKGGWRPEKKAGWGGADPGAEIRGEREIGIVEKEDRGSLAPLINESGQSGQNPPSEEPRLWSNK